LRSGYIGGRVSRCWRVVFILFEVAFETLVIAGWQPRYRLPVDIMLMAFAGVVYAELAARWFGGQKKLE
jgi:hypothetical protein